MFQHESVELKLQYIQSRLVRIPGYLEHFCLLVEYRIASNLGLL